MKPADIPRKIWAIAAAGTLCLAFTAAFLAGSGRHESTRHDNPADTPAPAYAVDFESPPPGIDLDPSVDPHAPATESRQPEIPLLADNIPSIPPPAVPPVPEPPLPRAGPDAARPTPLVIPPRADPDTITQAPISTPENPPAVVVRPTVPPPTAEPATKPTPDTTPATAASNNTTPARKPPAATLSAPSPAATAAHDPLPIRKPAVATAPAPTPAVSSKTPPATAAPAPRPQPESPISPPPSPPHRKAAIAPAMSVVESADHADRSAILRRSRYLVSTNEFMVFLKAHDLPPHPTEAGSNIAEATRDEATAFTAWLTENHRAAGLIGTDVHYRLPSTTETRSTAIWRHDDHPADLATLRPFGIVLARGLSPAQ